MYQRTHLLQRWDGMTYALLHDTMKKISEEQSCQLFTRQVTDWAPSLPLNCLPKNPDRPYGRTSCRESNRSPPSYHPFGRKLAAV